MIAGLLCASTLSLLGSRMTMVALPWLVLVTTGSPATTGLVGAAELLPYVLACALGGPLIDRVGGRRVSIVADTLSVGAIGAVPLLFHQGRLGLPALVGLVAVAGALRGFGDTAKRGAMFPQVVAASTMDLTRAASLVDGASRAAGLVGVVLAGVLVVWLGSAANVLLVDAATFAVCALLVAVFVRVPGKSTVEAEPYPRALAAGLAFLRRDRLVLGIVALLFVTNMLDQGFTAVLLPLWARDLFGSAAGIALVGGSFGAGAVLGNVAVTALAPRLPRWPLFAFGFLIAGSPRFFVLPVAPPTWVVIVLGLSSGLAAASLNPVLSAVLYERVPEHLQARVQGLAAAVGYAGMPLGALLCGWLGGYGVRTGLIIAGVLYLLVTLAPFAGRTWREMDRRPSAAVGAGAEGGGARVVAQYDPRRRHDLPGHGAGDLGRPALDLPAVAPCPGSGDHPGDQR